MVPKLTNSVKIVHKIISAYPFLGVEFVHMLDQCVDLRRNIIEVYIDISTKHEVKEMMLRIPKSTLDKVTQTHTRKLLKES